MLNPKLLLQISLLAGISSFTLPAKALSIETERCAYSPTKNDNFLNWQADYDKYCLYYYYNDEYAIGKKGNKYAIYDVAAKKPLTDFIYDAIHYFDKHFQGYNRVFIFKKGNEWGVLDTLGNEKIFKGDFDSIEDFVDGVAIARKDKKYGVIDLNGNIIVPLKYGYMNPYSHGFTNLTLNGKSTFVDTQGKLLTPLIYDDVSYFGNNGLSSVYDKKLDKLALITRQGKLVSPFVYDNVKITQEPVTIVVKGDKLGLVDSTGKLITPIEYQATIPPGGDIGFFEHLFTAKDTRTNKYGMFDKDGNVVVPFIYDDDFLFYNNVALVKKNGKQGFLDRKFTTIIPIEFDYANYDHTSGLLRVVKANKTGFYDKSGKLVIPVIYDIDEKEDFENGKIKVSLDGQSFYLDIRGKKVQ